MEERWKARENEVRVGGRGEGGGERASVCGRRDDRGGAAEVRGGVRGRGGGEGEGEER